MADGGLRVDRILDDELDLAAQNAAGGVDLLDCELHPHLREFAERAEEAGDRREVPDADHISLRLDDGRHSDSDHRGRAGRSFQERTAR